MIIRRTAAAVLAVVLATAGGCATRDGFPGPPERRAAGSGEGYLDAAALARVATTAPIPPAAGSPEETIDRTASQAFAALEGGDRWLLAGLHAELSPALAVQHFDCPLGARLAQAEVPTLRRLLDGALRDVNDAVRRARGDIKRNRPIADDSGRRPCVRATPALREAPSWPSAGAAAGAAYGLVFAAAAPDQAQALRRIGHEIGVSRAVCGLDYPSDVAAGQALGEAVFAALIETSAFRADLARAADEVARARVPGAASPGCAAERLALGPMLP